MRASGAAIKDIAATVMEAYRLHVCASRESSCIGALPAYNALELAFRTAPQATGSSRGTKALGKALLAIEWLAHEKSFELELRARECAALSATEVSRGVRPAVLDPRLLGIWLRNEAYGLRRRAGTPTTERAFTEYDYFERLTREHANGRDPWIVSREIVLLSIEVGHIEYSRKLKTAHLRLLRAMTRPALQSGEGSSEETSGPRATPQVVAESSARPSPALALPASGNTLPRAHLNSAAHIAVADQPAPGTPQFVPTVRWLICNQVECGVPLSRTQADSLLHRVGRAESLGCLGPMTDLIRSEFPKLVRFFSQPPHTPDSPPRLSESSNLQAFDGMLLMLEFAHCL